MTATPQTFDDVYELTKKLGQGSYGEVYQCKRKDNNEDYAVKSVLSGRMPLEMIQNEVDMCIQLRHPNVIKLYEYYIDDSNCLHHLVFEMASGGELYDDIYTKECYTEVEASHCFEQILQGLAYIHKKRIVHRDLKADNILLHETGDRTVVKIADFGAAVQLRRDESFEYVGKIEDTGYWMAPEMPLGLVCSLSVDLWACGTMLHIIVYGLPPFNGEGEILLDEMLNAENLFSDDNKDDGVSDDVKHLIDRFLITDPDHRMSAEGALEDPFIVRHRNASSRFHRPMKDAKPTESQADEDYVGTSGTSDNVRDEADIKNEQTPSLTVLKEERGSAEKKATQVEISRVSAVSKKYLKVPSRNLREVRRSATESIPYAERFFPLKANKNVDTTSNKLVEKNEKTSSLAVLNEDQGGVRKESPLKISSDLTANRSEQVSASSCSSSIQIQDKMLKSRKRSAPKVSAPSMIPNICTTDDVVPLKRSATVIGFSNKSRIADNDAKSKRPSSIACSGHGSTIVHASVAVQTSTSSEGQLKKEHPKNIKSLASTKPHHVAAPKLESPISPDLHSLV